jgi:hypothetical protein
VHVAVVPDTQTPVGVTDDVTQHVFTRRSHVAVPSQVGAL